MTSDAERAAETAVWRAKTYYFCCATCQKAFEYEPDRFVEPDAAARPEPSRAARADEVSR